jgi:hypothetical protein
LKYSLPASPFATIRSYCYLAINYFFIFVKTKNLNFQGRQVDIEGVPDSGPVFIDLGYIHLETRHQ